MYTRSERDVSVIDLPGRRIRVLAGQNSLPAKFLTFGVTELPPRGKMSPHLHTKEEEVIFILEGRGDVYVDNQKESLEPGTVIYLPVGKEHYLHNTSATTMRFVFAFSPPVIVGSYDGK